MKYISIICMLEQVYIIIFYVFCWLAAKGEHEHLINVDINQLLVITERVYIVWMYKYVV